MKIYDTIIIGAGFSGIYQLYTSRDQLNLKTLLIEEGNDIGGTWYWNRYPGSRCDSESYTYCYTFSEEIFKNWTWKEKYPKQEIILRYLKFVTNKLKLKKDMLFRQKVISAIYNEKKNLWKIKTNKNKIFLCKYLISAVGSLSATNVPKLKGLKIFKGSWYHSGRWPKKRINFKNKNVGQIGTGSTGIQIAPVVANVAKKLIIFQRTPNFSIPARNTKLTNDFKKYVKKNYKKIRKLVKDTPGGHPFYYSSKSVFDLTEKKRNLIYEKAWKNGGLSFRAIFKDIISSMKANKTAANFIKKKILLTVKNKKFAQILTKFDHPFTAKRPTLNTNYFETFNKKNVELVDLKTNPIIKITKNGILTKKKEFKLDKIIFATGYDAFTGSILSINIIGKNNTSLKRTWKNGPKTFLGLLVPNFPNFFIIQGPGSPSVLTNVPVQIEQHVEWITNCIKYLEKNNKQKIETTYKSANYWSKKINNMAYSTLYMKVKSSWYKGDNIPGKPKVFIPYPGGMPQYRKICEKVETTNYKGFKIV